jgi:hypothetical protein
MSLPRRNTRSDHPPGGNPPPPGFQSVLNLLLAQRDAALGVTVPSQPIARWESSSQPEILWELLAERCRAGIPPSLLQEQNAAVEAALAHIPTNVVESTIVDMEQAVAASQGASPALTVVSDSFWDALQAALPASRIPTVLTSGPTFQEARLTTSSGGSSPMDTSLDGILPPPRHSAALVTPLPAFGDIPEAPILLSSDSESPQIAANAAPSPVPTGGGEAAPMHTNEHAFASPLRNEGGESDGRPSTCSEGELPSDQTPIDSVSSWGRDAGHPLELSSETPSLSSFHSSQAPDVPDMGSARRGGKMSSAKATEVFEEASPAVLARARYLNVVPARDTRSSSQEAEARGPAINRILQKFAVSDLTDGAVFAYANMDTAHEEAETTLTGAEDELNSVRVGFSHYYLRDQLELLEDPSVPVEGQYLGKMATIVAVVLSGGPRSTKEGEEDVYASLLPGDWFCLATFITAAIARGCICTSDLAKKGNFEVEPCKDDFSCDKSLTKPRTQADLLKAVSAQVVEELNPCGALLPQDSETGLRATIWRAHEGQIRAWTEKEVLSVYKRLSDICLLDIMDKLEVEAPVGEITDCIRTEIEVETRGKYLGLIAQEKSKAFHAALEVARTEALREARAQGAAEAEQKGRSYMKVQLDRAEDEACTEAARIFKKRLQAARDKMTLQVEAEIRKEHDQAIAGRHTALEVGLMNMDFDARVEHIRSLAIQVGLLDEPSKGSAGLPKQPSPPKVTAAKAVLEAGQRKGEAEAAKAIARFVSLSAASQSSSVPPPEPSPCPAAGEDDLTPKAEPMHIDWAEDASEALLPLTIDFDSKERSTGSSIHCADNTMTDNAPGAVDTLLVVASFRDADSGALNLSPSSSPVKAPQSEVAQLFRLIMDTIKPIKTELKRIGNKVDGRAPQQPNLPASGPAPAKGLTARVMTVHATTPSPPNLPNLPSPALLPTSASPAQRVDDEEREVIALISDDSDFPPLGPTVQRNRRRRGKTASVQAETQVWNSLILGAPAPIQRSPGASRLRLPQSLLRYSPPRALAITSWPPTKPNKPVIFRGAQLPGNLSPAIQQPCWASPMWWLRATEERMTWR